MGDPYFPVDAEKVADSSIATKVAIMLSAGKNRNEISKELGISYGRIHNIMKSEACVKVMRDIMNHEKEYAKARVAQKAVELIEEAFRVIKEKLKKNDLKAASLVLKATGVFEEMDQIQNDSKLIVVMPGASPAKAIDIDSEIKINV